MSQEVKYINIRDLVLWTENPRDPITGNAVDEDIISKALDNKRGKWNLKKLAENMGEHYDFSELPIVVYHDEKPIVYDGNRRVILGKIKHGLVSLPNGVDIKIPSFPEEVPCNVCGKEIALKNIYRKHSGTGSWQPLERDIFLHKFMKKEKSPFLVLDETTKIISENPHLNKRFVRDEIFEEDVLKSLGFFIEKDDLYSVHDNQEGGLILSDISRQVKEGNITTRKNRGKVIEILDPSSQRLIDRNRDRRRELFHMASTEPKVESENKRQTRRTKTKTELFGSKLYLRPGEVSNLYRDIKDLYEFYTENKVRLSQTFPSLIRMSLRLLCETAAKDRKNMKNYLRNNFDEAKKELGQDLKTFLANHNVTKESIVQLIQTGAHDYKASGNFDQTIALSIIIGEIIKNTYGKDH